MWRLSFANRLRRTRPKPFPQTSETTPSWFTFHLHPANFACKFPCRLAADNARGRWPSTSHKTPPVVPFSTPGLGPATKSTDTLRWSCAHRHWAKTLGHRCTRESWSAWSGGRALHMRRWLTLPTRLAYHSHRFRLANGAERVTRATWCVAVITIVLDHVDHQFSCWQLCGPRGADNTLRGGLRSPKSVLRSRRPVAVVSAAFRASGPSVCDQIVRPAVL